MSSPPPLLQCFFENREGRVLYKAYPPHRGDDVQGLVELATTLPNSVRFKPIPPESAFLLDIRRLLPELLVASKHDLGLPDEVTHRLEVCSADDERTVDLLRRALRRAIGRVQLSVPPQRREPVEDVAERALAWFRDKRPDVLRVLLRFVTSNPRHSVEPSSNEQDGNPAAWRDAFRKMIHVEDHLPTLIIGRPDMLLGYGAPPEGQQPTDLRRLLDSARYPNRFSLAAGRMRDRKTSLTYSGGRLGHGDVGFITIGRHHNHQPVVVANGYHALGTYAAIRLLIEDRPVFQEAMERFTSPGGPSHVDIGFRCWLERLNDDRPFPLGSFSQNLRIELINPDDMLGYTWGRRAYDQLEFLFSLGRQSGHAHEQDQAELRDDDYMRWSLDSSPAGPSGALPRLRLFSVGVEVKKPCRVSGGRYILPSEPLGKTLDRMEEDMRIDLDDWRAKLDGWRDAANRFLTNIERDPSYRTHRPILLLGETGVGKQWIADAIADRWGGETLEDERPHWPWDQSAGANGRRLIVLNAARDSLAARIIRWYESFVSGRKSIPGQDNHRMLTFSAVSCPETLLDSELFGIAKGAGTDVRERPGEFVMAGSGVLFLDELLELPLQSQARLLVSLDSGKVYPAGAGGDYSYACRLIAATNRAADEADLRRLAAGNEIRSDLVARFTRRYELPPLRRRTAEIIPLLITLLRHERLCDAQGVVLRISRPALEALVTHGFPENIRDLRRLADSLPDELVASFTEPVGADSLDELPRRSVLLKHLACLGVSLDSGGSHDALPEGAEMPVESEFYQFSLDCPTCPDWRPNTAPVSSEAPPVPQQPARSPQYEASGDASNAPSVNPTKAVRDALAAVLKTPQFNTGLKLLYDRLFVIHAALLDEPGKQRLDVALLRLVWPDMGKLAGAPLCRLAEEVLKKGRKRFSVVTKYREAVEAWRDVINDRLGELQTHSATPNRRRLHQDIVLSVLLGCAVEPSKT